MKSVANGSVLKVLLPVSTTPPVSCDSNGIDLGCTLNGN